MGRSVEKTSMVSRGKLSGVVRSERLQNRAIAAGDRDGVDEAIYYRARLILGESLRRPASLRSSGS